MNYWKGAGPSPSIRKKKESGLKKIWERMGVRDREALILIVVAIVVVAATVFLEKKFTGYYPWGHPRTPIITTIK